MLSPGEIKKGFVEVGFGQEEMKRHCREKKQQKQKQRWGAQGMQRTRSSFP